MPLKLPDEVRNKREKKFDEASSRRSGRSSESLQTGDSIEYSITLEVSAGPGQKAWVKFGSNSVVRESETTDQAVQRLALFVESEIDRRLDELSD